MMTRHDSIGAVLRLANTLTLDCPADDPVAPMLRIIADADAAGMLGDLFDRMRSWYREPGGPLDQFGPAFHVPSGADTQPH